MKGVVALLEFCEPRRSNRRESKRFKRRTQRFRFFVKFRFHKTCNGISDDKGKAQRFALQDGNIESSVARIGAVTRA